MNLRLTGMKHSDPGQSALVLVAEDEDGGTVLVGADRRPALEALEALAAGEGDVWLDVEEWQIIGRWPEKEEAMNENPLGIVHDPVDDELTAGEYWGVEATPNEVFRNLAEYGMNRAGEVALYRPATPDEMDSGEAVAVTTLPDEELPVAPPSQVVRIVGQVDGLDATTTYKDGARVLTGIRVTAHTEGGRVEFPVAIGQPTPAIGAQVEVTVEW
jgi:hypothetical protein